MGPIQSTKGHSCCRKYTTKDETWPALCANWYIRLDEFKSWARAEKTSTYKCANLPIEPELKFRALLHVCPLAHPLRISLPFHRSHDIGPSVCFLFITLGHSIHKLCQLGCMHLVDTPSSVPPIALFVYTQVSQLLLLTYRYSMDPKVLTQGVYQPPLGYSFSHLLVRKFKYNVALSWIFYTKSAGPIRPTPRSHVLEKIDQWDILKFNEINDRNEISTATPMFSGSSYSMRPTGMFYHRTRSGKSNMAASKPEVSISQLARHERNSSD